MDDLRSSLSENILSSCQSTFTSYQALRYDALLGVTVNNQTCLLFEISGAVGMLTDMNNTWNPCDIDKEKLRSEMATSLVTDCWKNIQNMETLQVEGMVTVITDQSQIVFLKMDHHSTQQPCGVDIYSTEEILRYQDDVPDQAAEVSIMDEDNTDTSLIYNLSEQVYHVPSHETPEELQFIQTTKNEQATTRRKQHPLYEEIGDGQVCPICSQLVTGNMTKHVRAHTAVKPYNCNDCDKKFTTRSSLNRHCSRVHDKTTKPGTSSEGGKRPPRYERVDGKLVCPICLKILSGNMAIHIRSHTGVKPYPCKHCDKKFTCCSTLKRHQFYKHSQKDGTPKTSKHQRRYERIGGKKVCPICKKLIMRNMAEHIRGHKGIKPYACTECSRKFRTRTTLRRHQANVHHRVTFDCNVCGKKHYQQSQLDDHMNVHTGATPYECDICGVKFNSNRSFKCHKEQQHIRRLRCGYCSTPFDTEELRRQHEKEHQSGKVDEKFENLARSVAASREKRKSFGVRRRKPTTGRVVIKICDRCDVRFTSAQELIEHNEKYHQNETMCEATESRNQGYITTNKDVRPGSPRSQEEGRKIDIVPENSNDGHQKNFTPETPTLLEGTGSQTKKQKNDTAPEHSKEEQQKNVSLERQENDIRSDNSGSKKNSEQIDDTNGLASKNESPQNEVIPKVPGSQRRRKGRVKKICDECKETFTSLQKLMDHMLEQHHSVSVDNACSQKINPKNDVSVEETKISDRIPVLRGLIKVNKQNEVTNTVESNGEVLLSGVMTVRRTPVRKKVLQGSSVGTKENS